MTLGTAAGYRETSGKLWRDPGRKWKGAKSSTGYPVVDFDSPPWGGEDRMLLFGMEKGGRGQARHMQGMPLGRRFNKYSSSEGGWTPNNLLDQAAVNSHTISLNRLSILRHLGSNLGRQCTGSSPFFSRSFHEDEASVSRRRTSVAHETTPVSRCTSTLHLLPKWLGQRQARS